MPIRAAALPHTVTVVRRTKTGARDAHGNPVVAETTGATLRARVDPTTATEDLGDEQREELRWLVFLGADADGQVDADDALDWDDRTVRLELDGPPMPFYDGANRLHHFEVNARRITGA